MQYRTIAEVLVHHNKVLKLTSDINDLTCYASPYLSASDSNPWSNDDPEAKVEKQRIENSIAELTTTRDIAKRAMQKLFSVLVESDMWPSAPPIEDMQKQKTRVGEYVKALEGVMKKVAEELSVLTDLTRSLREKDTREKKQKKGRVERKEFVKGQEQDTSMMDVDAEHSYTYNTTLAPHQPITENADTDSEAEFFDSDSVASYPKTRHSYQKLQSRIRMLSEQVDTLRSTLDETESTWLQGTQDLHSSLLSKHRSSLTKYRDSLETSVSPYVSSVKASLTQLSDDATNTSRKVDQVVQEEARLSERIMKLEEERDRLTKRQKKFFEEELPEWKRKFEEYDKEREMNAKRVSVLEAALRAFERRPPGLHASLAIGDTCVPSLYQNHPDSSQSPLPSQEPQSSIMNLLQPRLKHYLREQVKPIIEEVKNKVEAMVNSQREDMRVVTWAKMDLAYKVLDEIRKQVGVDMAAEDESASVSGQGGIDALGR